MPGEGRPRSLRKGGVVGEVFTPRAYLAGWGKKIVVNMSKCDINHGTPRISKIHDPWILKSLISDVHGS